KYRRAMKQRREQSFDRKIGPADACLHRKEQHSPAPGCVLGEESSAIRECHHRVTMRPGQRSESSVHLWRFNRERLFPSGGRLLEHSLEERMIVVDLVERKK